MCEHRRVGELGNVTAQQDRGQELVSRFDCGVGGGSRQYCQESLHSISHRDAIQDGLGLGTDSTVGR